MGRFQTHMLHEAHRELIEYVQARHNRVIIFLGLSPLKVTYNNPLDFDSRRKMIQSKYGDAITISYIKDVHNDELWSATLDDKIRDLIGPLHTVTLYGGRDSFIKAYKGKFQTTELETDRIISASELRRRISVNTMSSPDFMAGVIWATQNGYPSTKATVDIAIFNSDRGKLLLARKPNVDKYQFVGGFSDPDSDSFELDAKREVVEETGIEVGDLTYIGSHKINNWRYSKEQDKIKTLFFVCTYLFGNPVAKDDISELRWFPYTSLLAESVVEEHQVLLKNLSEKIHFVDRISEK